MYPVHEVTRCPSCYPWCINCTALHSNTFTSFIFVITTNFSSCQIKENSRCSFFVCFFSCAQKTTLEKETAEVLLLCESSRCTFKVRGRKESHASSDQTQLKDKVQPFPLFVLRLVEPQISRHPVVKTQRGFLKSSTCICGPTPVTYVSNKAEVLLYPVMKP